MEKKEIVAKKVANFIESLPTDFRFGYCVGFEYERENLMIKIKLEDDEWVIMTSDDTSQGIFDFGGVGYVPSEVLYIAYELHKAAVIGDLDFVWDYFAENPTDGVGRNTIVS